AMVGEWYDAVEATAFTWSGFAAVHEAIVTAGRPAQMLAQELDERDWMQAVLEACPDDTVRGYARQLVSRPLPVIEIDSDYAISMVARLLELDTLRQTEQLRSRLMRIQNSDEADAFEQSQEVLRELDRLEAYRRQLRETVQGS
ncbi:MAG: hypothetical protein RL745_40, partial [Actinomycetota bacterium]